MTSLFCRSWGIVVTDSLLSAEDMPYWVVSAMKCLANCKFDAAGLVALFVLLLTSVSHMTRPLSGPNGSDSRQQLYPGFERDVLRTVGDYFQRLKEPLLTFHLYEVFVNILSECWTTRTCRQLSLAAADVARRPPPPHRSAAGPGGSN